MDNDEYVELHCSAMHGIIYVVPVLLNCFTWHACSNQGWITSTDVTMILLEVERNLHY